MKAILQFEHTIHGLYGVYLDSLSGFRLIRKNAEGQKKSFAALYYGNDDPTAEQVLAMGKKASYSYSEGEPDHPDFVEIHTCTFDELISRNEPGGMNQWFLGNMFVVNISQYWEHYHRDKIAECLRRDKLEASIMGDICKLRNAILHENGNASSAMMKCELLKWYTKGNQIFICEEKAREIVRHVQVLVRNWKTEYKRLSKLT